MVRKPDRLEHILILSLCVLISVIWFISSYISAENLRTELKNREIFSYYNSSDFSSSLNETHVLTLGKAYYSLRVIIDAAKFDGYIKLAFSNDSIRVLIDGENRRDLDLIFHVPKKTNVSLVLGIMYIEGKKYVSVHIYKFAYMRDLDNIYLYYMSNISMNIAMKITSIYTIISLVLLVRYTKRPKKLVSNLNMRPIGWAVLNEAMVYPYTIMLLIITLIIGPSLTTKNFLSAYSIYLVSCGTITSRIRLIWFKNNLYLYILLTLNLFGSSRSRIDAYIYLAGNKIYLKLGKDIFCLEPKNIFCELEKKKDRYELKILIKRKKKIKVYSHRDLSGVYKKILKLKREEPNKLINKHENHS